MKSLKDVFIAPTLYIRKLSHRKPQDTEHRRWILTVFGWVPHQLALLLSQEHKWDPSLACSPRGPGSHSPASSLCSSYGCLCSHLSWLPGNPATSPAALWPSSRSSPPTWQWSGGPLCTPSGCEERGYWAHTGSWLSAATLRKWPLNPSSRLAYFLHPNSNLSIQHSKYSYTTRMRKTKIKNIPIWLVVCGWGGGCLWFYPQ